MKYALALSLLAATVYCAPLGNAARRDVEQKRDVCRFCVGPGAPFGKENTVAEPLSDYIRYTVGPGEPLKDEKLKRNVEQKAGDFSYAVIGGVPFGKEKSSIERESEPRLYDYDLPLIGHPGKDKREAMPTDDVIIPDFSSRRDYDKRTAPSTPTVVPDFIHKSDY